MSNEEGVPLSGSEMAGERGTVVEPADVVPEAEGRRPGGPSGPEGQRQGSWMARGHAVPVAAVVVAAALSFLPGLRTPFVGDDLDYVAANEGIRRLGGIPAFFGANYWNRPGEEERRAYRPIVEVTLAVDHALWGLRPVGFRLTNVLLHALTAVVLYAVAFQLARHRVAALLTAVLFAAHPVHAEVVNVIKNRGDILATLFCLLSWLAFIGMVERAHAREDRGHKAVSGARGLVVGVLFFILALFSKEVAIALPILLLIYTAALVPVGWRGWAGAQTLVWWVALWGYMALSLAAIEKFSGPTIARGALPGSPDVLATLDAGGRALVAVKSMGVYLGLLALPVSTGVRHEFHVPVSAGAWPVVVSLAALGLIVVVCVVIFRRHRLGAFALAWLPIALLPVSNVVLLGGPPIAEHRLYLPAVGWCLFLGAVAGALACRRLGRTPHFAGAYRIAVIVLAVLAAGYVVRSATRSWAWESIGAASAPAGGPTAARQD